MKELSIEQKAAAYDEAIERANELLYVSDKESLQRKIIESILPELKENENENEDERIRKEIINYFEHYPNIIVKRERKGDYIAWLEKQGQHANFINNIQVGDKVTRNRDGVLVNLSQLNRVAKKQDEQETLCNKCKKEHPSHSCQDITELGRCALENQSEQESSDNIESRFKAGDKVLINEKVCTIKLVNEDNYIVNEDGRDVQEHFSYAKDWKLYEQNPAWSEEDEKQAKQIERIILHEGYSKKLQEQITDWFKSLKDRMQTRQEWSEEDARLLDNCISLIEDIDCTEEEQNWLKFLKNRHTWRPSDEQMEALTDFIYVKYPNVEKYRAAVKSLYQDLKKLREE